MAFPRGTGPITGPVVVARLRLASGLLLFTFAGTHLLDHSLGNVSLAAMEAGRTVFAGFWRSPPIALLLLTALVLHPLLALARVWERRTLRMPWSEWLQLGLGLTIPWYLTIHVLGTLGLASCCGVETSYTYVVSLLWPNAADRQITLVALVWLHGCIGVHRWLRLFGWYARFRTSLAVLAALLPVLAVTGFVSAGREVEARLAREPEWLRTLGPTQNWPTDEIREERVYGPLTRIETGFALLLGGLVVAWTLREALSRSRQLRVTYDDGAVVRVPAGLSILEASRVGGVPHASVCGGRGRCSTCRVRVTRGVEHQPPPADDEQRVLARVKAAPDVRLACRLRPVSDVTVIRLMPAGVGPIATLASMSPAQGHEREIAVLFADLRGFTQLAERRLPYDTVFLLNRYFAAMGEAIEAAGGRVDKFIGDGIMALFGLETDRVEAARQSLVAAVAMAERLEALGAELASDLPAPLRMGIGIHEGAAIVGEMGYGRATSVTAIGDTVNVASRLEGMTKELGCMLVVSEDLLRTAGVPVELGMVREVTIRGRATPMAIRGFDDPRRLRTYLDAATVMAPPRAMAKLSAIMRRLSDRG